MFTTAKNKLLIVMITLTVITFGLATALTHANINALGRFTLKACNELRESSLNDSKNALITHSREELLSVVRGRATMANIQLKYLENEIAMIADLSGHYLLGNRKIVADSNEEYLVSIKKTKSKFAKSRVLVYAKDSPEKSKAKLQILGRLHPFLKYVYTNQSNLDLVYLCTNDGYYLSFPWTKIHKDFSPFNRKWYKKAIKAAGKTVWIGPYSSASNNKMIITCAKAIKNFNGKVIAVCALDITLEKLTRHFVDMKLNRPEQAFLINQKGNILTRHTKNGKTMTWHQKCHRNNLFEDETWKKIAKQMITGNEGIQKLHLKGLPEVFVAYTPVKTSNWSIGIIVESAILTAPAKKAELITKNNIQKYRKRIKKYFGESLKVYLVLGIIVLIVLLTWGFAFSNRINMPILMLKKKALQLAQGNFDSNIHLHTGDELEQLDKTFDKMTKDISRYVKHTGDTIREREKIEQDFAVTGNIQSFMLPSKSKKIRELTINSYLKSVHKVSGDFYNYFMVDDENFFFCIGKVNGEGLPAAMLMAQAMTLLSHLGSMQIEPEKLLLLANNTLAINNNTDMSIATFCGFLNVKTGKLRFSNAKYIPMIYIGEKLTKKPRLEKTPALGISSIEKSTFKQKSLQLKPKDILFFTTNGIDKAVNPKGELLGKEYLLNSFKYKTSKSYCIKFALERLKRFYGSQMSQVDVTLLSIEYKGEDV